MLKNISTKISVLPPFFKDFNCTSAAVSSGNYSFRNSAGSTVTVYCDMKGENCGGEGGWMRVAYINTSEPGSQCPQDLNQLCLEGNVYCGGEGAPTDWPSTSFPVFNISYTKVCGQVRGYQRGRTLSFYGYYTQGKTNIDDKYVDGVSITHGKPREHIEN